MNKLAEALRAKQHEQDLSLRGLARELGVATGTAEGWVKEWRTPRYEHLRPLSEYLDVPIEDIIAWIVESDPSKGVLLSSLVTAAA